jgi:hypothetical protein
MSAQAKPKSRIPEFTSVEEEAAFWDSHDLGEFEDEFEPVEIEFARPLGHVLSVRFDSPTFHRLLAHARKKGVGASTLARMWVLEALEQEEQRTKNGSASN